MASASGANVPMMEPAIRGNNIRPPGTFIMALYMGKRETSLFMGYSVASGAPVTAPRNGMVDGCIGLTRPQVYNRYVQLVRTNLYLSQITRQRPATSSFPRNDSGSNI